MSVRDYRDLKVWKKAMRLVVESYRATDQLPRSEQYGLSSQIRRAAVSVPSNIAEGQGREHVGDYIRHLSVANGSLMELETQLLIASELGYLQPERADRLLDSSAEVGRMLAGLMRALRRIHPRPRLVTGTRNLKPDT